jgi:hypothetical protein
MKLDVVRRPPRLGTDSRTSGSTHISNGLNGPASQDPAVEQKKHDAADRADQE